MCTLRTARIINGHTTTICDQTRHAGMVQFVKNSSKNNVPRLLVLQFCRLCVCIIWPEFLGDFYAAVFGGRLRESPVHVERIVCLLVLQYLVHVALLFQINNYASMCVSFMLFYCACCKVIAVMDCPFNRITVFYLRLRAPKLCTYMNYRATRTATTLLACWLVAWCTVYMPKCHKICV